MTKPPKALSSQQVLILTPGEAFVFDRKGAGGPVESAAKVKGLTQVVDLTDTAVTTFGNFPEFTEAEAGDSIRLDPRDYLPREAPDPADLLLDVLPTRNEQDQTAALIGYVRKEDVTELVQGLNPAQITTIEPGIVTAARSYLKSGTDAALLQVIGEQMIGLLVSQGKVRARLREIVSPARLQEQGIMILSGLAGLGHDVTHVGLLGTPASVQAIAQDLSEEENLTVTVFTPADLAQVALDSPPLLNIRPKVERQASPLGPLLLGAAIGFLPGLVLSAMNSMTQRHISAAEQQTAALLPQVQEADRISAELGQIRDVQSKARDITEKRVNWDASLGRLIGMLPESGGNYAVRLRSLSGGIVNPQQPADQSAAQSAATGGAQPTTGTESASVAPVTPAVTLNTPRVKYDLEMLATSRYAATSAVTNLEKTYDFQLDSLTRNQTGGWDLSGTATEKEETK